MLMGISMDEVFRIKPNRVKYIENIYPLIDLKMYREDCISWMQDNKYPKPPRSACTFCPYHNDKEWAKIKENKEEWAEVVAMDKAIRNQEQNKKQVKENYIGDQFFLHRSTKPIDEIDFDKSDNQIDFFNDVCEGGCGL